MIVRATIKNGFTLVEMLVVIAIMSILTVITVGQFNTARMKARDTQRKADLGSLSKALNMYFADYGYYPTEINGATDSSGWINGTFADETGYVYMKVLPKDNTQNDDYPYCLVTLPAAAVKPGKFAVVARLENPNDSENTVLDKEYCNQAGYTYMVLSPNASVSDFEEGGEADVK